MLAVLALFLLIAGYAGVFFYSLHQVEIKNFSFGELKDVSLTGFTVQGNLELYNGGVIPIKISSVNYTVVLEASGAELARGHVEGAKIYPKQSVLFPISSKINWAPTAELLTLMMKGDEVYIIVKGDVYLVANIVKLPFEKRINIAEQIIPLLAEKAQDAMNSIITKLPFVS